MTGSAKQSSFPCAEKAGLLRRKCSLAQTLALSQAMTERVTYPVNPVPPYSHSQIVVIILRRLRAHDGVAEAGVFAVGMVDVLADGAGLQLDARGALEALRQVVLQRGGVIVRIVRQHVRQAHRVLQRHAGALREILQGRVRGVAEQHDAAVDPLLQRIAVAQHPELPVLAVADDVLGALMDMDKAAHHLVVGNALARDRLRRVVVVGDDEVEHLPARQRVMHDVAFRPGPQRRRVPAQIFRHLLGRDHRAVGGVARDPRRAVGGDRFADIRPQPVGADQQRTRHALAGSEIRRHRRAVLIVADHFRADAQFDQRMVLAGFQKYAMQVAAMHHGIGIFETRAKGIAEVDMGDLL